MRARAADRWQLPCTPTALRCLASNLLGCAAAAGLRRRRGNAGGHSLHDSEDRQQIIEVGHYGLQQEVEQLKRDKNVLMQEVIRLRQQQQVGAGQGEAGPGSMRQGCWQRGAGSRSPVMAVQEQR